MSCDECENEEKEIETFVSPPPSNPIYLLYSFFHKKNLESLTTNVQRLNLLKKMLKEISSLFFS